MVDDTDVMTRLLSGYRKFKAKYYEKTDFFDSLVEYGQQPKVLVIACCDARVDPAIVTQSHPGDMFVVRNVANLVPPFQTDLQYHGTSAAIEFAVKELKVSDIIVFGHQYCGGIDALFSTSDAPSQTDFLHAWMSIAQPAKEQVLRDHAGATRKEQNHHCEKASLSTSLDNLRTFPWISEQLMDGSLSIHGWYFDMDQGLIKSFDPDSGLFTPLK